MLWCCLWGRGQKGNNTACSLHCSLTFQRTLLWDWEFLPPQPPQDFAAKGFESLISRSASPASPAWSAALLQILSAPHPLAACLHSLLQVWMNVSLTPWLSEFHVVCYSGSSGCLLFLNWLLFFFWLCKEAKHFYLHLYLSPEIYISIIWNSVKASSPMLTWSLLPHKGPRLLPVSSATFCMWLPYHGPVWQPIHPCEKKKGKWGQINPSVKVLKVPHSTSTYISIGRI